MSRVNTSELPINAVKTNKPKVLTGLTQNETVSRRWGSNLPSRSHSWAPAERQHPTHPGSHVERRKPVFLPDWESVSRGTPVGMRVGDGGGSEGRSVIETDRCESHIAHHAKAGQTSAWSFITRTPWQSDLEEAKQMAAATNGAATVELEHGCWCGLPRPRLAPG